MNKSTKRKAELQESPSVKKLKMTKESKLAQSNISFKNSCDFNTSESKEPKEDVLFNQEERAKEILKSKIVRHTPKKILSKNPIKILTKKAWGIVKNNVRNFGRLYSCLRYLDDGKIVPKSFSFETIDIDDIAELCSGTVTKEGENQGKKYAAYKLKDGGEFVEGTFTLIDDEEIEDDENVDVYSK